MNKVITTTFSIHISILYRINIKVDTAGKDLFSDTGHV